MKLNLYRIGYSAKTSDPNGRSLGGGKIVDMAKDRCITIDKGGVYWLIETPTTHRLKLGHFVELVFYEPLNESQ